MNTMTHEQRAWRNLIEDPLGFVSPEHVHAALGDWISASDMVKLRKHPRFDGRLLQQLISHFRLQPLALIEQPDALDLPVLVLSPEAFSGLPRLCGALWHAPTLSREIRGDVVSELRRLLGNDAFALALANREVGGAANLLRQPAELLEVIDRDGAACVSAWLRAQPSPLRDWLRLRFADPQVDDLQVPGDLNIVRIAAGHLVQPAEEVA